jgi:hypothetical protein
MPPRASSAFVGSSSIDLKTLGLVARATALSASGPSKSMMIVSWAVVRQTMIDK